MKLLTNLTLSIFIFMLLCNSNLFAEDPPDFMLKWGSYGSGDGQFFLPYGVAVDSSGNVYVADCGNHRIQKFDSSGVFLTKWGSYGSGDGQLWCPIGIAVDDSDNIYVVEFVNNRIQKFNSDGEFITKWGSEGSGDGEFTNPHFIAVDNSGFVYVADTMNSRVQKFSSDGEFITKWGGSGEFYYTSGIAVDSDYNVFVSDWFGCRIQKFTSEGVFLTKWGTFPSGDVLLWCPMGIAVNENGDVYVADQNLYRIQKFTTNGNFLTNWNENFNKPSAVTVDNINDVIYVCDTFNHRIMKFGSSKISAVIDIQPGVFNLKSKGNYITCLIELDFCSGYDVYDIDQTKDILLQFEGNEIISTGATINNNKLITWFDRQAVYDLLSPGEVEFTVSGTLTNGNLFAGIDYIEVKDVGKDHTDEDDASSVEY